MVANSFPLLRNALLFLLLNGLIGFTQQPSYQDVAPLFNEKCVICHNGPYAPRQLRLDSYQNILSGSENGPVVVAGKPEESELIRRVKGQSLPRMPLTGPPWLSDEEIALLEAWIRAGMPEKPVAPATAPDTREGDSEMPAALSVPLPGDGKLTYQHVEPIFRLRCMKCHNVRGLMGPPPEGFRLDSYEELISAEDRARVVPGFPGASELIRRVKGQARPRMPFDGPPYLSPEEIALLERWVQEGARDKNGQPAPYPLGAKVRLHGTVTARWALDGYPLKVTATTRLKKAPDVGAYVEVRGRLGRNGEILVERIRPR